MKKFRDLSEALRAGFDPVIREGQLEPDLDIRRHPAGEGYGLWRRVRITVPIQIGESQFHAFPPPARK